LLVKYWAKLKKPFYFNILAYSKKPIAHRKGEFLVFARSESIKSQDDLPKNGTYGNLRGLISHAKNPDFKERVISDFGDIDLQKIIIIDEDEKPPKKERILNFSVISICCFFIFLGLFIHSIINRIGNKQ
jgi:hypothetical protein